MSDNNNININTPDIGPYTHLQPFRFWCQKVLPLVYDESLSYYELLCKVVDYLNKTMEDVDQMITDMGEFQTAYTEFAGQVKNSIEELETFITNYFNNLDVQEEINNKLDAMAAAGYFNELFDTLFRADIISEAGNVTSAWIAANLLQETGYVIDTSLTVAGAAADAQVTGEKVNSAILNSNLLYYGTLNRNKKLKNDDGTLSSDTAYDTTDYIPVSPHNVLLTNTGGRYWFYKADKSLATNDGNGVLATNTVGNTLAWRPNSEFKILRPPTDAAYIRITYNHTTINTAILLTWNEIEKAQTEMLSENPFISNLLNKPFFWNGAINHEDGTIIQSSGYRTTDYINITNIRHLISFNCLRYAFYDSNYALVLTALPADQPELIDGTGISLITVPSTAVYFRITVSIPNMSTAYIIGLNPYIEYLVNGMTPTKKKMYCIGDSITRGMWTNIGDSSSSGPTDKGYPYWIGQLNGYEVVNLGESGGGYLNKGTQSNKNAKDIVDGQTFSDADFVTIAMGVNDWKASTPVTLGSVDTDTSSSNTVIGAMMYCIEDIMTKKPTASVIILLPMNQNRFENVREEDNWSFGTEVNGATLSDYRTEITKCANYYNVKVVDPETETPLNRLNINTCLGDGLHPTKAFYKQMGYALAPHIH